MESHESSVSFDELLSHVIEALGQLANKHLNEVETLSREKAQARAQLTELGTSTPGDLRAASKVDDSRSHPAFEAATTSCIHLLEVDPLADAILDEHGFMQLDNTEAKPSAQHDRSDLSSTSSPRNQRFSVVDLSSNSSPRVQKTLSVTSLASLNSSKGTLNSSKGKGTSDPVKDPFSAETTFGEAGSVLVLDEDETSSEKGHVGIYLEPEFCVVRSNNHYQLKKIWFDHIELDKHKLANMETCLLKDARWIKMEGLPSNEGVDLNSQTQERARTAFRTVEEMRKACQSYADCVGFAYWPARGWCFPKKAGTGFDPDTATYSQKIKDEIWEWHYMPSRAQLTKNRAEVEFSHTASMIPHRINRDEDGARYVMHPRSKVRAVWLFISIVLVAYDMVMVPVSLCFTLKLSTFDTAMQIFGAIFWTLDVPLNFCTGIFTKTILEMRPRKIARAYLRSWFVFDVVLVTQEWIVQTMSEEALASVSLARAARWARIVRLLRIVRMVRFSKVQPMLRHFFYQNNLDKHGIALFGVWANMTLLLFFSLHMIACCWHALGELDDGWVAVNNLNFATVKRRYAISLRWTMARLHGMATDYIILSTDEIIWDSVLIFLSLFFACIYAGQVSSLSAAWASSRMFSLRKLAHKYSAQHSISIVLQRRVQNYLRAAHYGGAVQMASEEHRLLSELPRVLQEDLLFEARIGFIRVKPIFEDMYWLSPRAVQHLCKEAFSVIIAIDGEKIFEVGDNCERMVFITSGACWYNCDKATLADTTTCSIHHPWSTSEREFLLKGAAVSEATLWTQWVHSGTMSANEETMLLGLDAAMFGNVVQQHVEAIIHAVKYGKRFIWHLNQDVPSDLLDFAILRLDYLDQDFLDGNEDRHLMFISHYKREAGTEATLMRDTFEQLLKQDPGNEANFYDSPVFVDSENLEDLAALKGHVERSQAVLLLLTPGLFTRPWCLVEVATAMAAGIKIVPVEIQSPQFKYRYPDEDFYSRLVAGEVLNEEAHSLLRSEGFDLADVERTVREAHMKIALPFSPHKSRNVRLAELQDILRRCSGNRSSEKDTSLSINNSLTSSIQLSIGLDSKESLESTLLSPRALGNSRSFRGSQL